MLEELERFCSSANAVRPELDAIVRPSKSPVLDLGCVDFVPEGADFFNSDFIIWGLEWLEDMGHDDLLLCGSSKDGFSIGYCDWTILGQGDTRAIAVFRGLL